VLSENAIAAGGSTTSAILQLTLGIQSDSIRADRQRHAGSSSGGWQCRSRDAVMTPTSDCLMLLQRLQLMTLLVMLATHQFSRLYAAASRNTTHRASYNAREYAVRDFRAARSTWVAR